MGEDDGYHSSYSDIATTFRRSSKMLLTTDFAHLSHHRLTRLKEHGSEEELKDQDDNKMKTVYIPTRRSSAEFSLSKIKTRTRGRSASPTSPLRSSFRFIERNTRPRGQLDRAEAFDALISSMATNSSATPKTAERKQAIFKSNDEEISPRKRKTSSRWRLKLSGISGSPPSDQIGNPRISSELEEKGDDEDLRWGSSMHLITFPDMMNYDSVRESTDRASRVGNLIKGPFYPSWHSSAGALPRWNKIIITTPEIQRPRTGHTAHIVGDEMIVCGGHTAGEPFYIVYLDSNYLDRGVVRSLDQTSVTSRIGHASVVLGNKVYIFGGWCKQALDYSKLGLLIERHGKSLKVHQESPVRPDWDQKRSSNSDNRSHSNKSRTLPPARRDGTLVKTKKRLILFGGFNGGEYYNDVWVLNEHWEWSQKPTEGISPSRRRGHGATMVDGTHNIMYVFGGMYGRCRYLGDFFMLDPLTWTWTEVEATFGVAPSPRAWHSMAVIKDQIIVFGGVCEDIKFHNDLHIFDTNSRGWFPIEIETPLPAPRASNSICIRPKKDGTYDIIIFGGVSARTKGRFPHRRYSIDQEHSGLQIRPYKSSPWQTATHQLKERSITDPGEVLHPMLTNKKSISDRLKGKDAAYSVYPQSDLWVLKTVSQVVNVA